MSNLPAKTKSVQDVSLDVFERKKINKKLSDCIIQMLLQDDYGFYAEVALRTNFTESSQVPTAGVNVTGKGMNFYYNENFINKLNEKEIRFLVLHEEFHLLWDHPYRTSKQHNKMLANIVQDMIINQNIVRYFKNYIEVIKDEKGNNTAIFIPKEYKGPEYFEALYDWVYEQHQKRNQNGQGQSQQQNNNQGQQQNQQNQQNGGSGDGQGQKQQTQGGKKDKQKGNDKGDQQDQQDGNGQDQGEQKERKYGKFGKDDQEMYDLDDIFDMAEQNGGQFFDSHMEDEISEEMKREMVKDMIQGLHQRGLIKGDCETLLENLRRRKKDHLKEIKKAIGTIKHNTLKDKSYRKPNRKVFGLKGKPKQPGFEINCMLDTSGSMHGYFEKVLSYIFRSDIVINMIQCDTEIQQVIKIKNIKEFKKLKIAGLGGTVLQPGIDYIANDKRMQKFNLVCLSDTMHEELNFDRIKGKVLYISAYNGTPPIKGRKKVRKIIIDDKDLI